MWPINLWFKTKVGCKKSAAAWWFPLPFTLLETFTGRIISPSDPFHTSLSTDLSKKRKALQREKTLNLMNRQPQPKFVCSFNLILFGFLKETRVSVIRQHQLLHFPRVPPPARCNSMLVVSYIERSCKNWLPFTSLLSVVEKYLHNLNFSASEVWITKIQSSLHPRTFYFQSHPRSPY